MINIYHIIHIFSFHLVISYRPDKHWSYELLIRLDFLQAALENAPQCVIQLYALITQSDEDIVLGLLTLIFSFIDFIRVSVSIHWDMHKGRCAIYMYFFR